MEDWYQVKISDVEDQGGHGLLNHYGGSLIKLLLAVYPDFKWQVWRFNQPPKGYWNDLKNQREFFDWMELQLGIQRKEDWYEVKTSDLKSDSGIGTVLQLYKGSLPKALETIYSDYNWTHWRFKTISKSYFDDLNNQKTYLHWIRTELKIEQPEDWYSVKTEEIKQRNGQALLQHYGGSLFKILSVIYPEHSWIPWRFEKVPPFFWEDIKNQKNFFDWLGKELQIEDVEDWYHIKAADVDKKGGCGLLINYYGGSIIKALKTVYPEISWQIWKFDQVPRGYWNDMKNQRDFFDWLAKQLELRKPEEWYSVKLIDIERRGGGWLLNHLYGGSLVKALSAIYPESKWHSWKFEKVPKGFWDKEGNVVNYLQQLSDNLGIVSLHDWNCISSQQIKNWKGDSILKKHGGGVMTLVSDYLYPSQNWKEEQNVSLVPLSSKAQRFLYLKLLEIFPNVDIQMDYKHPELIFTQSNQRMQLDIFIPSLALAFEYQGEQHYHHTYLYGSAKDQQKNDLRKKDECKQFGITLIEVPYWWNHSTSSLVATIRKHRPELFQQNHNQLDLPIPEEIPEFLMAAREKAG